MLAESRFGPGRLRRSEGQGRGARGAKHCFLPRLGTGLASDHLQEGRGKGSREDCDSKPPCKAECQSCPSLSSADWGYCLPSSLREVGGPPCSVNSPQLDLNG